MAQLAFMDGVWRGPAWTLLPSGEKHSITQTERIGSFLDGSVKVIEGKGYEADGKVSFNAFGTISYSFTLPLYDSPVQMMPSCDHTGVPVHFLSSTTSGSAISIIVRILPKDSPRQPPSAAIFSEMSSDADGPWLSIDLFMLCSWKFQMVSLAHKIQRRTHCSHLRGDVLLWGGAAAVGVDLDGAGVARAGDAGTQAQRLHFVFDNTVHHQRRANDAAVVVGERNVRDALHCLDDGLLERGLGVLGVIDQIKTVGDGAGRKRFSIARGDRRAVFRLVGVGGFVQVDMTIYSMLLMQGCSLAVLLVRYGRAYRV